MYTQWVGKYSTMIMIIHVSLSCEKHPSTHPLDKGMVKVRSTKVLLLGHHLTPAVLVEQYLHWPLEGE